MSITNHINSYAVAATGVSSPAWVPIIEAMNGPLATILTGLGIILTVLKIVQHMKGKDE